MTVKIAIAGVGNCASALVQGLDYYRTRNVAETAGLMHPRIDALGPADIRVVAAFDIDRRKVGRSLEEAIFAKPNCTHVFQHMLPVSGVTVQMGPILDGCADHMADYDDDQAFRPADAEPVDVAQALIDSAAEVLICYLPVGSERAVRHYAEACLQARVAMVNCVPVFIASDPEWAERFRRAGVPIIGDDIKSQVGATIVHRTLSRLFNDRGVALDRTYQLNVGGNTDFLNMLERTRLASKKKSKTQSVQSALDVPLAARDVHIGPSDYVPWQNDNKVAFIRMEGRGFGDVPIELEVRLSVEDSPNSAGVVIDAVRCAKLSLRRGLGGPLEAPSAYYMKSPPVQMRDTVARDLTDTFIEGVELDGAVNAAAGGTAPAVSKVPHSALVLAAGFGSRLFGRASLPKPLAPIQGLTMAERVLRGLQRSLGIDRFVVAVGHEAQTLRSHFRSVAARLGVRIEFVLSPDWIKGNGASALAAEGVMGDKPFVLTMCDHLYDDALPRRLTVRTPAPGHMLLAVDFDKDRLLDVEDATKVKVADGAIGAIGKELDHWDAADTGVMYCTSGLFEGLRAAAAKGRFGLSDGLAWLASRGRAGVVDVTGSWWVDVDTPETMAEAVRVLSEKLRASA